MRWVDALLVLAACGAQVDPTPPCVAFVECLRARDVALGRETDMIRFEPAGACWGSAESAEFCTGACERGLAFLREAEADTLPSECGP